MRLVDHGDDPQRPVTRAVDRGVGQAVQSSVEGVGGERDDDGPHEVGELLADPHDPRAREEFLGRQVRREQLEAAEIVEGGDRAVRGLVAFAVDLEKRVTNVLEPAGPVRGERAFGRLGQEVPLLGSEASAFERGEAVAQPLGPRA